MYVIEHALLNLEKNKGRNILLGVIIFAIITATVVALAIFNTTGVILDETRTALQCAVRIAPHMQTTGDGRQMITGRQQPEVLSIEQYQSFAKSEYLDGADIKHDNSGNINAVYFLKRPQFLSDFEAELRSKGLSDDYNVKTDESMFESAVAPIESLKNLSLTFLIIIIVLGAVIMVLLSAIAIRERKYEIGVLRAMGMKKKTIALGLWIETIAITCICFAIGMGVGTALSQPVSDSMMTGITQAADTGSTSLANRLNGTDREQSASVDVSVSGVTALEIFGVSLLLASIAGIISVSRITKCEPIKILMERN